MDHRTRLGGGYHAKCPLSSISLCVKTPCLNRPRDVYLTHVSFHCSPYWFSVRKLYGPLMVETGSVLALKE